MSARDDKGIPRAWFAGFGDPKLDYAMDVFAIRFGVPREVAYLMMLGVASIALRGRKVRLPFGKLSNLALYLWYRKSSGDRASAVLQQVAKAVYEFDAWAKRQHETELAQYRIHHATWATIRKGLLKKLDALARKGEPTADAERELEEHAGREPAKPRSKEVIGANMTPRAFYDKLAGFRRSLLMMTDEGDDILGSELFELVAAFNNAWDSGAKLRRDLAHGVSIVAEDPYLVLMLIVQEEVMEKFMKRSGEVARGSGQLARCLYLDPPSLNGYRFNTNVVLPEVAYVDTFHERIAELLRESAAGPAEDGTGIVYDLDPDATAAWNYFADGYEAAQQPGQWLDDMRDMASKAAENVGRLAAVLHGMSGQEGLITRDKVERANNLVLFHLAEAKRLFSAEPAITESERDSRKLEQYIRNRVLAGYAGLPRPYIYHNGPKSLRGDTVRFGIALNHLAMNGRVWITKVNTNASVVTFNVPYFRALPPA